MEPLTGEVFRMPHETELWDTHVLFYRHRIFSSPLCGSFFDFPLVRFYTGCAEGENVCILTQKSLVRDFTMFTSVAWRGRNWRHPPGITREGVRLGLANKGSMSAAWRTESAAAPLTCWSNCPASSMSARIIFWWAVSQVKRKSKLIFWALFRSCLRLRRNSNRALRLKMTK